MWSFGLVLAAALIGIVTLPGGPAGSANAVTAAAPTRLTTSNPAASGGAGPAAETRVGASTVAVASFIGAAGDIAAGQRRGNRFPQPGSALATSVAANVEASVVATERTAAQALKPSEAAPRWDEFLGGPTTNLHPRTGYPTPTGSSPWMARGASGSGRMR